MPPLPKQKRSKANKGMHRAHQHTSLPNVVECPHCHRPMAMHRVCPSCGFYRGRDVLGIETEIS